MTLRNTLSLVLLCLAVSCFAQIKLPALFSDNMVLQQQTEAAIWGTELGKNKLVKITTSWDNKTYSAKVKKDGQWKAFVATPKAGSSYTITIEGSEKKTIKNVAIGEVWLCSGQSNMEMPVKGFRGEPVENSNDEIIHSLNPNIRLISVPRKSTTLPQTDFEGSWKSASPSTTGDFSATAYYFAKLVQELTGVPIGLVDVNFGGSNVEAWMSESMLVPYENVVIPDNDDSIKEVNRTPTVLFNGMLSPVIGYTIKGAIWYQGESNAERPLAYEELFPDMVHHWRALWDQGVFPFYFVQIAPFSYDNFYPANKPWFANSAYLRDAQRKAQYVIPNSGMACILDKGDMKTIHPMDKKTPGERLAYLALAQTYGFEGFGFATPDFDELNTEENKVTLTFKNLPNGLTSYGKEVTAFEIAGEDKVFYPATCKVRRKTVQIWSDQVAKPIAVRYAFSNEGPAQLFSTEGIPVTSFRTDNWSAE